MLTIRAEQIHVLEIAGRDAFEALALELARELDPSVFGALRERQARELVHTAIDEAIGYGIDEEPDVLWYIAAVTRYGLGFARRTELSWTLPILEADDLPSDAKVQLLASRLPDVPPPLQDE